MEIIKLPAVLDDVKELSLKKCESCGVTYLPTGYAQKYCGSRKEKSGCSYKRYRESQNKWRKQHWDLEKNRIWNRAYYEEHKLKMQEWRRTYRKQHGKTTKQS